MTTTVFKTWTPVADLRQRIAPSMPEDPPGRQELVVDVTWFGPETLDRPHTYGWIFTLDQKDLAERLVRAINAGVVFTNPTVRRDVYGKSYISADTTQFFHKRHMNSSLKKVGY